MANERTLVERALYWMRICIAHSDRFPLLTGAPKSVTDWHVGIIRAHKAQAEREGFSDTAEYLQHIIDDLTR